MRISRLRSVAAVVWIFALGLTNIYLTAGAQASGTSEWAWMAGSNKGALSVGIYGKLGLPAAANTPGERTATVSWTDTNGNLWLFGTGTIGGTDAVHNVGNLDDVWEFNAAFHQWIWVAGSSVLPTGGSYGWGDLHGCFSCAVPPSFGSWQTPSATATPGGLGNPLQWTDKQGNLWIFSGVEYRIVDGKTNVITLNALWEFNVTTNQWAWMSGSDNQDNNTPGVYGTLGQAAPGNTPGGRSGGATWTDSNGRLWLFGGNGQDAAGVQGALNDLWMFDPATLEWTWMGGSDLLPEQGGAAAVFGTKGIPAPGNTPNGFANTFQWTDKSGNLWLFGGADSVAERTGAEGNFINNLWKLDAASHQWAWMGGSGTVPVGSTPGVYGTRGKASASNIPGGRSKSAGYSWIDGSGNFWMFGGDGFDSTGNSAELGDLWEFNPATNLWTWMGGPTTFKSVNGPDGLQPCQAGSLDCAVPGVYGALGVPARDNIPGTRLYARQWIDLGGNVWLFGGWGVDSTGTWGQENDFWEFSSSSGEWTWMGGSSTVPSNGGNSGGVLGVYGTRGVFSATNSPGGHSPAASWTDRDGNIWFFGGQGCNQDNCYSSQNDLWEYQLYAPSAVSDFALGAAPGALTISPGSGGTTTLSALVANGFSSVVSLSASAPAGISVDLNPASIAGAGSSTLTISVDSSVPLGQYSVAVTGTAAGVSHTVNVLLNVNNATPVALPVFTPAAGSYSQTQTVTVSSATPGATIHFTTDGTTPTTKSPIYSGPLTVSVSKKIQALAVAPNYPDSAVAIGPFTITRAPANSTHSPANFPTDGTPASLQLADVNSDGLPDILYQDDTTTPSTIQEALAQPDGSYIPGPVLTLADATGLCRTLDANIDGKIDLACIQVLDEYDVQVVAYLGNGDGTFQAPIFSAPMQSNVGFNDFQPWLFAPADIDSDGYPDLLVGDSYDWWTYVLHGDGTGRFRTVSKVTTLRADALATDYVFDINGDGEPDIVSSLGPTVLLGKGDGTFGDPVSNYQAYDSCVFHDMDKDGKPDAVCYGLLTTTGVGSGDVTGATELAILHGNGDGMFNSAPVATKTFGDPMGGYGKFLGPLAVSDLNGDGIADVLAYSPDGMTVLLGKPGLNFADSVHYAPGFQAMDGELSSFFADLNHDGLLDEAAAGPNGIYFSYGKKDGTFGAPHAYEIARIVGHVTVADFNGDGIPDIAATGDESIELSLGKGDGTFQPFTSLQNGGIDFSGERSAGQAQIVHGDFDGDGKPDLLALGASATYQYDAYILFGKGGGAFGLPRLVPNSRVLMPVYDRLVVLDFNEDGRDDVVSTDAGHIYIGLSKGDGTFTPVSTAIPHNDSGLNPSFPAFADFNGDGKIDAVYGQGAGLYILKGHGDGGFDSSGAVLHIPSYRGQDPPSGLIAVATGDFDGDGHPDVAALVQFEPGAVPNPLYSPIASIAFVYYGKGDGTFTAPVVAGVFNRIYRLLYAADLNEDGRTDLVYQTFGTPHMIADPEADAAGIQISLPGRTFDKEQHFNGGIYESDLIVADLDGDTYPDLLAVNSGFFPDGVFIPLPGNSVTELLAVGVPSSAAGLPTSTSIAASNSSIQAGTSVTFTATVVNPKAGAGTPTGFVTFSDQTGTRTSVPLTAQDALTATAALTTSSLGIGADVVNAAYSGDYTFASSRAQMSMSITGYASATSLTVTPNPGTAGQSVTVTATVANSKGSTAANPTGYVLFSDTDSPQLASVPLAKGSASASVSLAPGAHTITAWYSGDAIHASSTSTAFESVLIQTTVSVNAPASILTTENLSATVTVNTGTENPVASGSVTLSGGGYTSAPAALSTGKAAIVVPAGSLALGAVTLTAVYTPDAVAITNALTPSSGTTTVSVSSPPPTFSINSTPVSLLPGATTGNTSTVTITPAYGFTGTVSLATVESAHPSGAQDPPTLSFGSTSPVSISGTSAGTATLTIGTTAPSTSASAAPRPRSLPWSGGAAATLACIVFFGLGHCRRRWQATIGMLLVLVFLLGVVSCSGGGANSGGGGGGVTDPGTTPGTYSFTVTARSGSITQTSTVSLTVQ